MTAVNSIPTLHTHLRERRIEAAKQRDELAAGSINPLVASGILRAAVEADAYTTAGDLLAVVVRGPNTDALHRTRMFRDLLTDRLFETVNVAASPIVQAVEAERGRALKEILRTVASLERTLERAE